MTPEDIVRIAERSIFLSLDRVVGPRLVKFLYVLGLAAIILWAISHIFGTFALGFGEGLWGLLEVAVFGLGGVLALRVVCEAFIVFFKANEVHTSGKPGHASQANLIEEVRGAIEDLAGDDGDEVPATLSAGTQPAAKKATPAKAGATSSAAKRRAPARTAKRTPTKQSAPKKSGPANKSD